jgi:hypothetical protein
VGNWKISSDSGVLNGLKISNKDDDDDDYHDHEKRHRVHLVFP